VGPARIAYGTVIPAGTICRQDVLEEGMLFAGQAAPKESRAFAIGIYRGIHRIVKNNLIYIGNLWALREWYRQVRTRTMSADVFSQSCHAGAQEQIEESLKERLKRLKEFADKISLSLERARVEAGADLPPKIQSQQQTLVNKWPEVEARLKEGPPTTVGIQNRDILLKECEQTNITADHCKAVSTLSSQARQAGAAWLQEIVDSAEALWTKI